MSDFIRRVCNWNAIRYGKNNVDVALSSRLLREEVEEAIAALTKLENLFTEDDRPKSEWEEEHLQRLAHTVKELFDVSFVAVGVLYKLGFNAGDIEQMFSLGCDSNETKPTEKLSPGEKGVKGNSFKPAEPKLIRYLKYLNEVK